MRVIETLKEELEKRRRKNSRYSLRAFAKSLGISSSRLSEYLSGKRRPTLLVTRQIAPRIGLEPNDVRELLVTQIDDVLQSDRSFHQFEEDEFRLIADWVHYAILSLLETRRRITSPEQVANALSVSTPEAREALDRLLRLGLVQKKYGTWKCTGRDFTTTTDQVSSAIQRAHRQYLEQAISAINVVDVNSRDFSAVTIATTPEKMTEAKRRIERFRRDLMRFLESGEKTEVFRLQIQLLPVTTERKFTKRSGNK